MVTIRKLKPTIKIAMPKPTPKYKGPRPKQKLVVRRTNRDHPAPTPLPTPCRLWQGAVSPDGYGMHYPDPENRQGDATYKIGMHRWVVEQAHGRKLGPREFVMHMCDNRLCYRFDHLMIGSVQDNNADMFAKKRHSPPPVNSLPGASHPGSKLTDEIVLNMRRRYVAGATLAELSEEFGVHPAHCSKIARGKAWTHLPLNPEEPNA